MFSSRKIAAKMKEDVVLRVLGAENFPAHLTIPDFRKLHLEEFGNLFVQVAIMAREAGLAKLGTVPIDGTKMRTTASKRKAMSDERTEEAGEAVASGDSGSGESGEEDRCRGRPAIPMKRLEERQMAADQEAGRKPGDHKPGKKGKPFKRPMGEPAPNAQDNFTDPESRIMTKATLQRTGGRRF